MKQLKNLIPYFIFTTGLILALTVVFFNGSPVPFYEIPYEILFILWGLTLFLSLLFFLKKRKMLYFLSHISILLILIFFALNSKSFSYCNVIDFQKKECKFLKDFDIKLLNHEKKDTSKLLNNETATIEVNGKILKISLNHPAQLPNNIKIFVTGTGMFFLATKSNYLIFEVISTLLFLFSLLIFAFFEEKEQ